MLSEMAKCILCLLSLCSVLLVAWTDDRGSVAAEGERLWNTPPELIPEQAGRTFDVKNGRSLSFPITTNINVNAGNSAHSFGVQAGPQTISYSESNSFARPLSPATGTTSQSHSVLLSAGLTGVVGTLSEAISQFYPVHSSQGNANSQTVNFGSAAASSSASVHNGHATSVAASSAGFTHSTVSLGGTAIGSKQPATTIRFPAQDRPIWTNIRPNHSNNGHHPSRKPKLEIEVTPHREHNRRPVTIHVSAQNPRWQNRQPTVHISKWQPGYKGYYNTDDDEEI